MGRKNNKAGQPNRQAQMSRRTRHRNANVTHVKPVDTFPTLHVVAKTREESMAAHPAGKGLLAAGYAESVYGG